MPTPSSPFVPSAPSSTSLVGVAQSLDAMVSVAVLAMATAVVTQHGLPFEAGTLRNQLPSVPDSEPPENVYVSDPLGTLGWLAALW